MKRLSIQLHFSRRRPRGMLTADVVIGLMILAVLATSLVVATSHQRRAAGRFADTRGAVWAAEEALAEMQSGKRVDPQKVQVEAIPGDAAAPQGRVWVRVHARFNDRSASLIGLVPSAAVPSPAATQQGGRP